MPLSGMIVSESWQAVPKPACVALARALAATQGPKAKYAVRALQLEGGVTFIELVRRAGQAVSVPPEKPWASERETAVAAVALAKHLDADVHEVIFEGGVFRVQGWAATGESLDRGAFEKMQEPLSRGKEQLLPASPEGAAQYAQRMKHVERAHQHERLRQAASEVFDALWPSTPADWWGGYYASLRREEFPRYCFAQAPKLAAEIAKAGKLTPEHARALRELAGKWALNQQSQPNVAQARVTRPASDS